MPGGTNTTNRHSEDLILTQRILAGDDEAFDEFYDAYYDRVFRFCLRRLEQEDTVYDLVQQTMERALKYLGSYAGDASLYTWLCQICRNELSTWFKRSGNNPDLHVSIDESPAARAMLEHRVTPDAPEVNAQAELSEIVHIAVDELPIRYAKVLELKYLQGLSVSDISVELRISQPATESLLARSRRAFKSLLEELMAEQSVKGESTL